MTKRKYSEVEMIGALKQMEAGRSAAEVGRELGVSKHTVYAWKAKYGGMSVGEAQRLRQLEDENQRLKKLVADLSLDKDMLKAVIEKKRVELVERREEVHWLWKHFLVSQRRICGLMNVAESSQRYVSRKNDEALRAKLVEAAREKPRWGYRRLQLKLEEKGLRVNHKRVYRVYREAGLMIRRKKRKRLVRAGFVRSVVTRELEKIVVQRGAPEAIRCDNGPEFTSRHFLAWGIERKIDLVHIEPGRPVQNAFVESFHGKLRDECLNTSWFGNLFEARVKIAAWREEYNEERPHSSLGYLAPRAFARRVAAFRSPTAPCAPQLEELAEAKVMSSGDLSVV